MVGCWDQHSKCFSKIRTPKHWIIKQDADVTALWTRCWIVYKMFDALILHGRRSLTSFPLSLSRTATLLPCCKTLWVATPSLSARQADAAGRPLLLLATRTEQREWRALSTGCVCQGSSLTRAENFLRIAEDSQRGNCHICTHLSGWDNLIMSQTLMVFALRLGLIKKKSIAGNTPPLWMKLLR